MRATIIAIAALTLLSACARHSDCLEGARAAVTGEMALIALPFAYLGAGICAGITNAMNDEGTANPANKPPGTTAVPIHGSGK